MDTDKKQRLDETIASIRHQWGEQALRRLGEKEISSSIPHVPTGFRQLDAALGIGGVPKGYLTHLSGTPTSGATTLAFKIMAQVSHEAVVYVDCPHSFDADYAARCGVDPANLLLIQPPSLENGLESLNNLVDTAAVAMLVLDSREKKQRIDRASINRLITELHRSRCALIVVEQTERGPFADKAAVRLQLRHERWFRRKQDVSGYRTGVHILHNQFGRAGQSVRLTIGFSTVVRGDGA
jgi:predicted ATP-dependent serine protease